MPLLSVSDLQVVYETSAGSVPAVKGVSFEVRRGETLAVVGESGCGKSSLAKALLGLVPIAGGSIVFDGTEIGNLPNRRRQPFRRQMQMVFQDPFGSLNPRKTVGAILTAPLVVHGIGDAAARRKAVAGMLDKVGLPRSALSRYPHEFSGGQRQRIGIARALILQPKLVICDEPVSALDPSIQAQVLNLLVSMKDEFGLSFLFISHDLSVVHYLADRIMVMFAGEAVETAEHDSEFWERPQHPYSRLLLDAVPRADRRQVEGRPA